LSLVALIVAGGLTPRLQASGFQLREQSPSAQGNAFAGISAGGSDIGGMFFNPASLTLFSTSQVVVGGSFINPSATPSGLAGAYLSGGAISGPASASNGARSAVLPNLYAMWSLSKDLKLGVAVNAPYGLVTEYDSNFVGRYHALRSDLKTVEIAPTVAYRIDDQWSVGGTFLARKADATLSNAVDFGTAMASLGVPAPLGVPGAWDGKATLTGSKWAYGFKAGVTFQPTSALRLGLAYHSAMSMDLKGDVAFQFPAAFGSAPLNTNPVILSVKGKFADQSATAELKLPANTSLGATYDLTPAWSLQAELSRTAWSTFRELRVKFGNGVLPDSTTTENWKDTWFYSLGTTFKVNSAWTLRGGIAADQTPVALENRTPRIPDNDRFWGSVGAGYAFTKNVGVDFAYSHLWVRDSNLDQRLSDPNNATKGALVGTYKNAIDILTLQVRYTF
jgi:long-chain fatty acid transport protein